MFFSKNHIFGEKISFFSAFLSLKIFQLGAFLKLYGNHLRPVMKFSA